MIELETSPPYRITNLGLRIGGGPNGPARDALPAPPISASMPAPELVSALHGYLSPLAASGEFAGVVLVAKDGKPLFEKGYGPADRDRNVAVTPNLRFNVASIGKAFTKVAIGQLISQGKLALTDTIGAKLRDYPNPDAHGATIDQLLTHRGGIADFFGEEFDRLPKDRFASNADYYRYVAPQPLLFPPGTRNQYCNGCYIVLGEVIAAISGMPYERYIAERVLKPAGMTGAGFLSYGDPEVAPPYTRRRGPTPTSAIGGHGRRGSAAGGSFARAADLLAFDNAVREGRLLDERMTGWFFGGGTAGSRTLAPYGIAGGAIGANTILESDGVWTIVVVGNMDPPNASRIGMAIKSKLR